MTRFTGPRTPLGVFLKDQRERSMLTGTEIAHLAGIAPSLYYRLETGSRLRTSCSIIDAIADGMELSWQDRDRIRVLAGYAPISAHARAGLETFLQISERLEREPAVPTPGTKGLPCLS